MGKVKQPFVTLTQEELEAVDKDTNQLQGLAALFVGLDLDTITPAEHAGAAWVLSNIIDGMAQTFGQREMIGGARL